MNIDTPEGMAEAVAWQQQLVATVKDQGRWLVPRSGSIIVIDHTNKQAILVLAVRPEPTIKRVFEAMGWTWVDKSDITDDGVEDHE